MISSTRVRRRYPSYSTSAEAKEYLLLNLGYLGITASVAALVLMLLCFVHLNKFYNNSAVKLSKKYIVAAMLVCLATVAYGSKMFFNTGVMQTYVFAKEYFEGASRFKAYHEQILQI